MGKTAEPEEEAAAINTAARPKDPKMQAAKVHMLNGTSKDFELHRGSDGEVLFTLVSTELSIDEREYFSLCFYDEQGIRHWLYNDKKIVKQLKELPWEFSFEVKFYPTAPSTLNDDNARYNLFLQLRKDVAAGRLPATIPTHALLGAYVAQAEYGDSDSSAEYERYLKSSQEIPNLKDQGQLVQLLEKVKELHREQKGLTGSEAEQKYVDACKQLSMYGVFIFDAKDGENSKVGIGICATGINIYKETIRVHRFSWQSIVKISYKKNTFSVKLKAGELAKKEVTLHYKVQDYLYAKRVWKCGVEHHTFFRLIQPEDKPKGSLFRWGSGRFRYQGRTQFQTKMASQMFDHAHGGTVPRSTGNRLSQSCDDGLNKENIASSTKSATLGRDGRPISPLASPGVSYEISTSSKRAGTSDGKVGISLDPDDELVYTPVESPTSAAYYLSERSSLRSPYSSGAVSPNDWSAWGRDVVFRHSNARRNLFGRLSDNSGKNFHMVTLDDSHHPLASTARIADAEQIPIQQLVTLYNRGYYTEIPSEPTVRMQHYAPRNGYHPIGRLQPGRELDAHPIRFFVNLNNSGQPARPRIQRQKHAGTEDVTEPNLANYSFAPTRNVELRTLPLHEELLPVNIQQYSAVYYHGKGSKQPHDLDKPKQRLVARVLPQSSTSRATMNGHHSADESLPTERGTISRQSNKRKHTDIESAASHPAATQTPEQIPVRGQIPPLNQKRLHHFAHLQQGSSSEIVASSRDTTDRHDDLTNLPLEHSPRVPYVTKHQKTTVISEKIHEKPELETRTVRYIARIRHDGEEDVVEKDQVQPELYGLPSTSYEGPLEDTNRENDLEHQPLSEHSHVYHSGQSWLKSMPSPVKETHSERIEVKEPKKKAVLHVKSTPKATEVVEEKSEVRLLAKILPTEVDTSTTGGDRTSSASKNRESSSSLLGFLKTSGRKGKSTSSETSAAALPVERYEGPLDTTDRHDDLTNLPLEHSPRVPYVTKHQKTTVISEKIHEKPELETRTVRYIARIRHDGEEDVVEKDQVQPELYGLPSTSYEGPLEDTNRENDLEHQPLSEHSHVYHSGQSWLKSMPSPVKETHSERIEVKEPKKKAVLHVKSTPKATEVVEEKSEVRLLAKILPTEVDTSTTGGDRTSSASKNRESSSSLLGFLKTSGRKGKSTSSETSAAALPVERYEGPLDTTDRHDDLTNLPLEHSPRVPYVTKHQKTTVISEKIHEKPELETRTVRYIARIRHDGEEDVVEKDQVQPELYGLPSTSYEGPLEDTNRENDLEHQPLSEHSHVYHSGQSWLKSMPSPVKETHSERIEVKEPKKKAVLHVKSTPKATEVVEEKSEVRLLAKILPTEVDTSTTGGDRTSSASKNRESSSSLLGFLKTSGRKGKSTSSETSAAALPVERYEGPLDTTDRHDDLTNLPLEHSPRVPYVTKHQKTTVISEKIHEKPELETRTVRYIARIRHDGEEDVVEKDQVQPELYGLPSTSYEGPLEDTNRENDLEHQPLSEHSHVYHSGQSWLKSMPSPVKETHSERIEVKEPKKKAVLHVKSTPKATEVVEEKSEVRLLAKILPTEVDTSTTGGDRTSSASKNRESSSSLLGFLKTSGRKGKSTSSETSAAALPVERYEGPLDTTDRHDDLTNLPLEHSPRVPYVTKHQKTTVISEKIHEKPELETRTVRYIARIRHDGEEDVVEKDQVQPELYGLPSTSYEGPLEDTNRENDLEHQPLSEHSHVYHSGQSWLKSMPSPVKETHSERIEVKEPKKKAVLHVKSTPKATEVVEEKSEVRLLAKILPTEVDTSTTGGDRTSSASKNRESSSSLLGFLKTSGRKGKSTSSETSAAALPVERYEGPLDTTDRHDDLTNLPLEHSPRVPYVTKHQKTTVISEKIHEKPELETRTVRYIARIRHDGEEDVVEKDQVQPELYGLPSTSYEGPLEDTNRENDLEHQPLSEHSHVYHSGQSWLKSMPSPVKETHSERIEVKEPKKKAVLHVKSTPKATEVVEEKSEVRLLAKILPTEVDTSTTGGDRTSSASKNRESSSSLLGFLKTSGRKGKSTSSETSAAALPVERYEGPLDTTDRHDDLTNLPLEHSPRVPYVTKHQKTTVISEKIHEKPELETRTVRYIARIRHDGEEDVVEKDQVQPELYGLPSTSYEGPLEDTNRENDLEHQPLSEHSHVYHSGQSWLKSMPSPVKETHSERIEVKEPKKKAVLHVKSTPKATEVVEEKSEVRLLAKILPTEVDTSTTGGDRTSSASKNRESSSSLLGFLKTSGRKGKSTSSETSAAALPVERYEGPLDTTDRHDDLTNLPLEHSPRVPYVTKHQKTTVISEKIHEKPELETRTVRYIARIRHDGEEDVVEKDQVQPELYGLPSTSYEGPLEDTNRENDLEHQPLSEHSHVYHSGQSWLKSMPSPVKETHSERIEVKEPKKKAVLHVKSTPKATEVVEEKSEVRLLAKILPTEVDTSTTGGDRTSSASKNRESSSSLLGFLKTSGRKGKSTSSETSAAALPVERYEGPLDTTDRHDDLTNLPLEHSPRVPYVTKHQKTTVISEKIHEKPELETRTVRYIARIRHDGEEDVVEKDQVQPELYGLPSTSYEGPLEDTNRENDLEHQPLSEHSHVYHSGQSWLKSMPSPVKETHSERIEVKEPKKKAVLHVKSTPKATEVVEEKSEVRLLAKILPTEVDTSTTGGDRTSSASKNRESSSSLLGFLKTSGRKGKSTSSETSAAALPVERYEGPLDTTDRHDDLTNLPLEHSPRVPYVTKHQKTTVISEKIHEKPELETRTVRYIARIRHDGEEDVVEKDQVQPELYGLPSTSYEGPLEDTNRENDLEHQPLSEHSHVYHSGQSWLKSMPSPVKETHSERIEVKEPKKKAVLHVKSTPKATEVVEEKSEVRLLAKILPTEVDTSTTGGDRTSSASKNRESSSSLLGFLKTSGRKGKSTSSETSAAALPVERYEGPLDTTDRHDDLTNLPLEHSPRVPYVTKHQKTTVISEKIHEKPELETRTVRYIARIRHDGEEDVVEKDQVQPELYGLPSTSYEGPLEDTNRENDLEHQPLSEHSHVYHSGQSWLKSMPSPVKETHSERIEVKEPKKKAVLHVKSTPKATEVVEEKSEVRLLAKILPTEVDTSTTGGDRTSSASKNRESSSSLLGFLKTSGRKGKSTSSETSAAALPVERYEGPLDTTDRHDDLTNLPLEHSPRVPYVTKHQKTTVISEKIHEKPELETRTVRYIARIRHDGEEDVVEKDQVQPELYGLPSTSYEGPLEDTNRENDLEHQPLSEHSHVYHSGQSWLKSMPSPVKETHSERIEVKEPKKKAVLHVKSTPKATEVVEEKSEVRLLAKILPTEVDTSTTGGDRTSSASKNRESSSSLLGFLKTSGRKGKSTSSETSAAALPVERYEGPLDTTDRHDDLTNLPLEHSPRVPYVTKHQKTTVISEKIHEKPELETRTVRYIARIRHDGEEDVVEKDQVQPELYGLPSTSYEGPLEDTNRENDLEHQPLSEHSHVYHSGQSWLKSMPSPVKETHSERIEVKEPKKKAVLHVKSTPKATEVVEEKSEVRLLAKILPTEVDTSTTGGDRTSSASKNRESSSSLLGFLKTSGRKGKSTSSETSAAALPVERYEGPLDTTDRHDDLTNLPLEHSPRVPYVTKHQKTTVISEKIHEKPELETRTVRYIARIRHDGEEDVVEKDQVQPELYGLPSTSYEGPLEDTNRENDLEHQPLSEHSHVYHSGQSWLKSMPSPVKETHSERIEVKEPKKKAVLHVKSTPKATEVVEEKSEVRLLAKILPTEVDTSTTGGDRTSSASKNRESSSSLLGFLKTSGRKGKSTSSETSAAALPVERYEGPLDTTDRHDDLTNLPLEHSPRVPYVTKHQKTTVISEKIHEKPELETRTVRYIARIRHDGEEDVVEKDQVQPELYGLPSTSYEGPLEDTNRENDLEHQPLSEHSHVYHSGQSWLKSMPSPVKETHSERIEVKEPKKKAVLHVKSTPKATEVVEEKSEVRLLAKILPTEVDTSTTGGDRTSSASKNRESSSSLLGFLKTSGRKGKSTSSETSAAALPVERYEGPLDTTDRHDDLTNLPLEHSPRVPYVTKHQKTTVISEKIHEKPELETRTVRYIARIRHDGEEDVVEKDQVQPELYGLPSTSYEGPLEDTNRENDLEHQPLSEHSHVYHSGQSWLKSMPSPVKETHSERIEVKEPKKKAVLHVKSTPKATEVVEEKSEVRLLAKILPTEVDTSTTGGDRTSSASKNRESSSSLLGFLKTSGRKGKSTSSETSAAALPVERYEGPLDTTDRHDDLTNLPLEHSPRVPYVTKHQKTTVISEKIHEKPELETRTVRYIARIRHDGEEDVVEKDQVQPELYGLPSTSYEGPLEDTNRENDLEHQPLSEHSHVYHSGQSWLKSMPSPVKETHSERIEVKEPKKKAVLHVKSTPKATEVVEEKSEVRLLAKILPTEVDTSTTGGDRTSSASKNRESSSSLLGFLKTSGRKGKSTSSETSAAALPVERYEGPLDTTDRHDDLTNLPLEHSPRVPYVTKHQKTTVISEKIHEKPELETRTVRYIARIRHDGEEDVVEKDQVQPELYGLPSTSYEGPLEDTNRENDLEHQPLSEHSHVYHSGQSWLKSMPSPVKETHSERIEVKEPKKKAVLHVKSTPKATEVVEEKSEVRLLAKILPTEVDTSTTGGDRTSSASKNRESSSSLLGFLKTSGRKGKSTSSETSAAALPVERYEGPLDTTDRHDDLTNLPLEHSPRVPYVTKHQKTTVISEKIHEKPELETRTVRYIARIRHDGEEDVVEKDQVQPELYGLPSTSYEGPLEDTNRENDLEHQPLSEHSHVYHSGQSWLKSMPSPVKETHSERIEVKEPKKKAVLHVKSTPKATEVVEEKSEVRLLAKILPTEVDTSTTGGDRTSSASKNRESSSSLLGFLKTSGRKGKSTSSETSAAALPVERYEGPLDTTDRHDDLTNLPLEHSPRVPYVTKHQKTTVISEKIHEKPELETRTVRYIARIRHDGEEDVVEKDQVQPELYGLPSTSYEGPLEDTNRENDLEHQPLSEHSHVYHSGQSWLKSMPSPVKETHSERIEVKEPKKKAVLHVKSTPKATEVVEEKSEVRLLAKILPTEVDTSTTGGSRGGRSGFREWFTSRSQRRGDQDVGSSGIPHYSSSYAFHSEGTTAQGEEWVEMRVERRVEVHLEPVFCLSGAGLGALSEDEGGVIFTATPSSMAPVGRSFLTRLGFKSKKSKKPKGVRERNSSDSSSSDDDNRIKVVPMVESSPPTAYQNGTSKHKLVRHETKEQSYRLSGQGLSSGFNPEHPSLSSTIAEAERLNQHSPRLEHAERTITVRALAPLPVSFEESGQPHTTVASWQETSVLPDNVTVEYDDQGNRITRTVKTSQVKHTVQKQTFQNYTVPEESDPSSTVERTREQLTPIGTSTHTGPIVDTQSRSVVYETSAPVQEENESLGEFVSSKTVTSGNRTIETITYKTERDGIIETHVEHRVTIHSDLPIDHDAELSAAIAEATQMNPDMTVEKIEVRQETST